MMMNLAVMLAGCLATVTSSSSAESMRLTEARLLATAVETEGVEAVAGLEAVRVKSGLLSQLATCRRQKRDALANINLYKKTKQH